MNTLGYRLVDLLKAKDMTQKELAYTIGVSEVSISRYVNNARKPRTMVLYKMAEVLGVSAEYLLTGDKKEEYGKWIPVSEGLPTDDDYRYYMVLVENHIEDVPMFCQCDPYYGFGYYREIFDPVSLGYVDTEFNTLEELNYEKALYWMQLPEPPYEKEE